MDYDVGILLHTINEKVDVLTKFLVEKLEEAESKSKGRPKTKVESKEEKETVEE